MLYWFGLLSLPFLAALVGWGTNRVAIHFLFHPKTEKKVLGIKFQGVFPKRQRLIAERIADLIANNLLTGSDLRTKIFTADNINELRGLVSGKLSDYLETQFKSDYPLISIIVGKKSKDRIRQAILHKLDGTIDEVHSNFDHYLRERVDIRKMVQQKVESLDPDEVGEMMNQILSRELKFIEWTGAVLGFLVGCIQLLLTVLFMP